MRPTTLASFSRYKAIYVLALPGLIYFVLFRFLPVWGNIFAFVDFSPMKGIFGSKWVGFKHFDRLFGYPDLYILLKNTFVISLSRIILGFPVPIVLAIFLNDVTNTRLRRSIQSIIYLPHFISWAVASSILMVVLSPHGLMNAFLGALGVEPIHFLLKKELFIYIVNAQSIWKEAGWGTVIYLAALSGIDPQLYEAADIDGASRLDKIWHITIPGIKSTILILLILRIGRLINENFEQIYLLTNPLNRKVADVFETYVFRVGIQGGEFSYSTAVGIFKAIVAITMVAGANHLIKRMGERGIY